MTVVSQNDNQKQHASVMEKINKFKKAQDETFWLLKTNVIQKREMEFIKFMFVNKIFIDE